MQRGLGRSCRLLAHSWSWSEINWHNLNIWRMVPEGRTENLWDSKVQIWCKIVCWHPSNGELWFPFHRLVVSPCSHLSSHLQLLRLAVVSIDLWVSLARRGSILYVMIKGPSCCCAASSVNLVKQHCHNCENYCYWCRVFGQEQKRRTFFSELGFWVLFL